MIFSFKAGEITNRACNLFVLDTQIKSLMGEFGENAPTRDHEVLCSRIRLSLENGLLPLAKEYGLERTVERIEELDVANLTLLLLLDRLGQVWTGLQKDLQQYSFFWMPTESTKDYEQKELFGTDVASRFPKANEEITLAGNCYATGSYTACVFHLMRAVEIGARVMVSTLRVEKDLLNHNKKRMPVELCDWQTLITALQKGVNAKAAGVGTNTRKKVTFEFYNHALASFRNFKDAWRNHVSHTRELYQAGRAKDVLDNTRQFMQHLAIRLKE